MRRHDLDGAEHDPVVDEDHVAVASHDFSDQHEGALERVEAEPQHAVERRLFDPREPGFDQAASEQLSERQEALGGLGAGGQMDARRARVAGIVHVVHALGGPQADDDRLGPGLAHPREAGADQRTDLARDRGEHQPVDRGGHDGRFGPDCWCSIPRVHSTSRCWEPRARSRPGQAVPPHHDDISAPRRCQRGGAMLRVRAHRPAVRVAEQENSVRPTDSPR